MAYDTHSREMSVQIHGYCHATPKQITELINSGREQEAIHLGGNFVAIAERGQKVWLITSPYGVVPYFHNSGTAGFYHGPTVRDVLHRADGIEWRWNAESLADLFALEHLTKSETLHAAVERTPPASVLYWNGEVLKRWRASWSEIHDRYGAHGNPDRMVDLLCEETTRCADSSPVLSASGGFDSRVLLAALLAGGKKPELVVQGFPDSTDRVVVEAIGRKFNIKVRIVELTVDDYVLSAKKICRATSGTKPAAHWHTYIYTAKSGLSGNDRFFVGANGEFARTYYLDKGALSLAANCLPPSLALREFWKRKAKPALKAEDLTGVTPEVAEYLRRGTDQQALRLAKACLSGPTLHRLDHFYLEERVRHFIGNGLALYGLSAAWRAPFLSAPWVSEADKLPRSWKLGSNWHRFAIKRLCPDLLAFPEEHVAPAMAARHALFYWLPSHRRQKVVPYMDYTKVFTDKKILSLLLDHARDLDDLIDEETIRTMIEEQQSSGTRQRVISILLGLAIWRHDVRHAYGSP